MKKLREIKDLEVSDKKKIIEKWRRHSAKQDRLLFECLDYLDLLWKVHGEMLPDDVLFGVADLTWRIKYFFENCWIGK